MHYVFVYPDGRLRGWGIKDLNPSGFIADEEKGKIDLIYASKFECPIDHEIVENFPGHMEEIHGVRFAGALNDIEIKRYEAERNIRRRELDLKIRRVTGPYIGEPDLDDEEAVWEIDEEIVGKIETILRKEDEKISRELKEELK